MPIEFSCHECHKKLRVSDEAVPAASAASPIGQRGLSTGQRKNRKIWLGVLGAVYLISFILPRSELPHVPLCWLNATTGFPCPTCGLTRAFLDIGHGQFAAATALNLMSIPIFLLGLALIGILLTELRTGRDLLCLGAHRYRWALILIAAVSVLIRYLPMISSP